MEEMIVSSVLLMMMRIDFESLAVDAAKNLKGKDLTDQIPRTSCEQAKASTDAASLPLLVVKERENQVV